MIRHITIWTLAVAMTACGSELTDEFEGLDEAAPDDELVDFDEAAELEQELATNTVISQTPMNYATTNGDILTTNIAVMAGTRAVMIGGNFTRVITPNGVSHPATHFAILDLNNPNRVIYAAHGVNSYVRETYAHRGVLYVAGDFTTFAGQPRKRLAAIGTNLALKSWNPGSNSRVEALVVNDQAVFFGGSANVIKAVRPADSSQPGALIWSKPVSGGSVRVMMLSPRKTVLFVGGLFEQVGTTTQHGLVKLLASDGRNDNVFRPRFRPDSGVGPQGGYDGDCILSLAFDVPTNRVLVGAGGAKANRIAFINATNGDGGGTAWGVSAVRPSEGDVQAVAVVGDAIVMGYHRNHENSVRDANGNIYPTRRFMTLWNRADGSIQGWQAGFWGNQSNADGGNNGVQAMVFDAASRKLIVGGAFLGYGDPYDGSAADAEGYAPQHRRQSLAIFNVP